LNLRARLDALQDRIAQARAQLEAHGSIGDKLNAPTDFARKCDAIRCSLEGEGTTTDKASAETDALKSALDHWLEGVESEFTNPPPRKPTVSM
jgi:hypothetical protein